MNLFPILQAAAPTAQEGGNSWSMIVMMVLIVVVFYFFMIRPQQKRQKALQKARNEMKSGDKVITAGGIHGRIREVRDKELLLEIADGVRILVDKASVYANAAEAAADTEKK
ncbi:MAG: preprotein translocase subunit YajC [Porphyromonas sp.]|nr:preprotein translocase subunit YajC [Porphyromonas sp.]